MEEEVASEASPGGWEAWKRSAAAFFRSVGALASIRWAMATREASAWGRAMALRAALLLLALILAVLAGALLVAALVAALYAWWGSLVGALFAVFGICLIAIGGLIAVALSGRSARPVLERTAEELRRDFETFTGPEA